MRRGFSILLVLFFAFGPLQGLLEASDDARLPACCRRHGAHRCAMAEQMMAMMAQTNGSTPFVDAPGTCSSFPGCVPGVSTPSHALAPSQLALPVLLERAHSPFTANEDVRMIPFLSRAGRAPPFPI